MNKFLLVLLALAGCGGGGESAPTATPQAACVPLAQVRIQLFGDSTMAGYEGGASPPALTVHTPTVVLQQILDVRFGPGATLVTPRAVGGTTSRELVAGTDGLNQPWPKSVAADVIVVNHGINDRIRVNDLTAYGTALRTIAANTAGARLVFETPNAMDPVLGFDLSAYAATMRKVAAEVQAPLADTFALPAQTIQLGDWAHPTDAGYVNIVTQSLAPAVVPVVARLRCER